MREFATAAEQKLPRDTHRKRLLNQSNITANCSLKMRCSVKSSGATFDSGRFRSGSFAARSRHRILLKNQCLNPIFFREPQPNITLEQAFSSLYVCAVLYVLHVRTEHAIAKTLAASATRKSPTAEGSAPSP